MLPPTYTYSTLPVTSCLTPISFTPPSPAVPTHTNLFWSLYSYSTHRYFVVYYTRDSPPNWNLFIKNCIFILTCLNFKSPSKYCPFNAIYLSTLFSTAQKSFWICRFWCLSVLLPFSPLPYWQNISIWGLFHRGKKKSLRARSEE